jgi:hypothetical protein
VSTVIGADEGTFSTGSAIRKRCPSLETFRRVFIAPADHFAILEPR